MSPMPVAKGAQNRFALHYSCLKGATTPGITLPEVIITLLILATLIGISAPSFIHQLQKIQVRDSLLRIQGALRETQAEAIRRNQTCTLTIPRGTNQIISGTCLTTGDRPLKGVALNHNHPNSQPNWEITFDYKGRNQNFQDRGTLLVSSASDVSVQPQCLVISIGIGLMRIGHYDGQTDNISATHCIST